MISLVNKISKHYRVYGYWLFAIVVGVMLAYLETIDDIEPIFSISTFFYFSLLIFWGVRWIVGQIRTTLTQKKEKIDLELKHLQSQINPHFFFNTLNNLYGLVEKDAKQAQQLILKLSDMMRYSIYDGQEEGVTLAKEVAYLKDYVELHKMRYHKAIDIQFEVSIEKEETEVLPLLFIILLENAFKHGVENLRKDAYVRIKLISLAEAVYFEVENNFDPEEIGDQAGIGLKNLQRRLELAYPQKHSYSFSKTENTYRTQLKLQTT